jgi:hypothetical protein
VAIQTPSSGNPDGWPTPCPHSRMRHLGQTNLPACAYLNYWRIHCQAQRYLPASRKNKTPPRRGFILSPDIRYQATVLVVFLNIPDLLHAHPARRPCFLIHRIAIRPGAGKRLLPVRRVSQSLQTRQPTLRSALFCEARLVTLNLSYKNSNHNNATVGK